jgi:DNA polymerase III delta prime subunit
LLQAESTIITLPEPNTRLSPAAKLPCHVCRYPHNPYFVGREVILKKIHRHLHRPGSVQRSENAHAAQVLGDVHTADSVVSGPPGQGNTQTALSAVRTASYVISGPPGQGKTQTALKYFFDHQDYYKATLWAHADTKAKLLESFSEFAQRLGLIERSSDLQIDADCLMRWLENGHSGAPP